MTSDPDPAGTRPSRTSPPLHVLLAVVVLLSLARYGHDLVKFLLQSPFIDFAHYYTFATLASLGLDAYDPQAVQHVDGMLHLRRAGGGADYPPLFYVLMAPWTWMSFGPASVAWLLLGQLCLVASLMLCASRKAVVTPVRLALMLFVVLNFQPLLESVALGQSNLVALLLVTAAWWGLRMQRPWLVAAALAGVVHIKVQFVLLLVFLAWMGARQSFVRAVLLWGLGVGAAILSLGQPHYRGYVGLLYESSSVFADWIFNLSVRAGLYRLFGSSGGHDMLADGLWVAMGILFLIVLAPAVRNVVDRDPEQLDWAWGLALCGVLLFSPMTEEHHLVVLLLPLACLLWSPGLPTVQSPPGLLLLGSLSLLATPYSLNQFPLFHHGVYSLAMLGKTAGIAGLAWVLFLQLSRTERDVSTEREAGE